MEVKKGNISGELKKWKKKLEGRTVAYVQDNMLCFNKVDNVYVTNIKGEDTVVVRLKGEIGYRFLTDIYTQESIDSYFRSLRFHQGQ